MDVGTAGYGERQGWLMAPARCLMLCGTGQLDSLVYWRMALDVDFDVLKPPVLNERLRRASERVGRSLGRGGG
jgi:hypothetical protein